MSQPGRVPTFDGTHDGDGADASSPIGGAEWRGFVSAWLGWFSCGLASYTFVVAGPLYLGRLMGTASATEVAVRALWVQAAFLLGWAVGGVLFGCLGDRCGRYRVLCLTVLTFSLCTGACGLVWEWWHLLVLRFLAGLGVGGEWATGAALLQETWRHSRQYVSAALQCAFGCGIFACSAAYAILPDDPRLLFFVGFASLPLAVWAWCAPAEPAEWRLAQGPRGDVAALFRPPLLWATVHTLALCSVAVTFIWAFMFWMPQHLRQLPEVAAWPASDRERYIGFEVGVVTIAGLVGNFLATWLASARGPRVAFAVLAAVGAGAMVGAYEVSSSLWGISCWLPLVNLSVGGMFAIFPSYIPAPVPHPPPGTGSGLTYNLGRVGAAVSLFLFSVLGNVGDLRSALLGSTLLLGAIVLLAPWAQKHLSAPR